MRNFQKQVKKPFCYQKLFWLFTVCKIFANSWHSASNFKRFSRSLEQFFLTVGKNNFGNKIPMIFWTKFRNSGHSFRLARGLSYSIVSHTWSPQWMPGIILNWRYPVLYTYLHICVYFSVLTSFFMSKKYIQKQWKKQNKKKITKK